MPAPRILWRYVLRDVTLYTLLGLSVFTVLLVVQNVLRFLEELLMAGVSAGDLLGLVSVLLPSYVSYVIPTSLLFGILLAFGRMSADGEIIAMRASGISVQRLLPPVILLGLCAAGLNAYVSFEIEPRSYFEMKQLVRQLQRSVRLMQPGSFRTLGDRLVYVRALGDESCPLSGVLIADFSIEERTLYIAAQCGAINADGEGQLASLELREGSIHFDETDGGERYRRMRFAEMRTELDLGSYLSRERRARDLSFNELLGVRAAHARGETPPSGGRDLALMVDVQIHRRMAFALSSLVLGVLALPLGIRPLRSGRSWGALIATALMALYWCLFSVGEIVAERSWAPAYVALWLPNALVLLLALWLLRRSSRSDS